MSLYEKYRPTSLKDFIGNEDLKRDLRPFIRGTRQLPTALLFTGPSGCGKTTIARMLAKLCKISDLAELDTADFRGIDSIREIRRQMQLSPLTGNARAWILDEAHKLTNDAQNALLKALESPPVGVHFFLCTTDPQMLIKTILTRCTQFQVEALDRSELTQMMRAACVGEGKEIPDSVLATLAKQADGSPRAALSLLERVMGRSPDDYDKAVSCQQEFESQVKDLCQALLRKAAWKEVVVILKGLKEEPESIRWAVLGYMNAVLLSGKDLAQAALIIDAFKDPYFNTKSAGLTLSCYSALS